MAGERHILGESAAGWKPVSPPKQAQSLSVIGKVGFSAAFPKLDSLPSHQPEQKACLSLDRRV